MASSPELQEEANVWWCRCCNTYKAPKNASPVTLRHGKVDCWGSITRVEGEDIFFIGYEERNVSLLGVPQFMRYEP